MQQVNAPGVRWDWISEAWNLFTKQWSVWVLMILVMCLVMFTMYLVIYLPIFGIIMAMTTSIPQDGEIPTAPEFPVGIFLLFPLIFLAIACVGSWLTGGLYNTAFKQVRGERIAVGDLFSGGKYFTRILGAALLIGIAAGIGSILIIPALIIAGLTFLTMPMIVEGGKGTIDAIKGSIEITKRDWLMFTLFAIALSFLASAGIYACGFGLLATMPLAFLAPSLAYRDLVGIPGAQSQGQFMQPPPPPDYRDYAPAQTPAQPQAPAWAPPPNYGSTPAPEPAAKTCPHCGATLARAVNFCNQCGRPLRGA
ncbi:MAG TPA: zinc-ribbon domain-containing protein [Blastocatellia bacterium]|nr:zinc-ribbon domain-containing protein [Blastocatellia bacterium]